MAKQTNKKEDGFFGKKSFSLSKNKKTSIGKSHNTKRHAKTSKLYKKPYRGQGK